MVMNKKLTRRDFLKTAGAGTMGLSLAPIPSYARETDTLRIGYLPITDSTPLVIAHANGYYKDEGLKTDRPIRVRSWSTLVESFMTDKFNLTHLLLPIPIWMRFNKKAPLKVMAWNHTNGSAITVRSDSGINGFKDLGGKHIAVPYWYSMHNIILQMGLRKVGLKPVIKDQSKPVGPDEVNLFILPPPEMPLALSGKKIDGFVVAEPYNAISELKVGAKIMRFTGDIWKNHPCCVVVMKENLVNSNPVFTQKIMNAIVRAQLWISQNPLKTAKILSREGGNYLPIPEKILTRVFTEYNLSTYGKGVLPQAIKHPEWDMGRIGFQPFPYPSATRFIIREMSNTLMEGNSDFLKKLDIDFAARDLVNYTFVKNAVNNVGGPEKFGPVNIEHPFEREEIIEL